MDETHESWLTAVQNEHVCPTSFETATPLGLAKGGMLHDAQGHMIEVHGTTAVYMRLGPEGQSVVVEFGVTNVRTLILNMGKLVKQGHRFEAEPTGCKMSKGDRSVTLDDVKNSLWVDAKAYTTMEGARDADARRVAQWWLGYLKSCCQATARPHQALRQLAHLVGHQLSTWTVLHQLTTCESDCVSYEHQCGASTSMAPCTLEQRLNANTPGRTSIAGLTT